jgi:hypoxanthine-guanine phosphoribosyltransferase
MGNWLGLGEINYEHRRVREMNIIAVGWKCEYLFVGCGMGQNNMARGYPTIGSTHNPRNE